MADEPLVEDEDFAALAARARGRVMKIWPDGGVSFGFRPEPEGAHHVVSAREARDALREFVLAYKGVYIDVGVWRASVEAETRVMEMARKLIGEFGLE